MSDAANTGKVGAALFAMIATLVAALTGTFLLIQSLFPWMTVLNPSDSTSGPSGAARPASLLDVTNGGPTPAERTLKQVMATTVPGLAHAGWSEIRPSGGVPGMSFGFGCDPADGLAPVVAESRSWVRSSTDHATALTRAVGTLDVSARAYPAGGGAVAFAGLTDAVIRCDAATLYTAQGVGVEVARVVTSHAASLVWRRGDVLMVGTVTSSQHAGSIEASMAVFQRFDRRLKAALDQTCADQTSGVSDARRSPYLNRKEFAGNFETVPVKRPRHRGGKPAEQRTTNPVVPIPGPHHPIPYVAVLPTPPTPAVTAGPSTLPDPVMLPAEPAVPTATATNVTGVSRLIDDPDGPGCGWAFTRQVSPRFNADAADAGYADAVRAAKQAMSKSWHDWQDAKVSYYAQYADYVHSVHRYKRYAAQVARVQQAWAVVETARANYYAALEVYTTAVQSRADWHTAKVQARVEYKADKAACRRQDETPPASPSSTSTTTPHPTPNPTPKPTSKPTPTSTPSPTPTATPTPTEPVLVCPPPRPAALDAPEPSIPASPVPDIEAQLPAPSPTASPLAAPARH